MEDNSKVAIKNLLNNRGQAEKEFKVEVEAKGWVRHTNLARLLGYCAGGVHSLKRRTKENLEKKRIRNRENRN
uniref:non-specific serine/threonine protein kinase n=1 Tax=Manihot esculenta TaxID=3983 RepID=A0A2C9V7B6_MANES